MHERANLRLTAFRLDEQCERLRLEVREFLDEQRKSGLLVRPTRIGAEFSPEFSGKLGARGWIGMCWPKRYGGGERSALERYVVTEELLAAGAPVRAHWVADRQSGPVLLKFGTEAQRMKYLPAIARGECYSCVGLSEPDSGSDLVSIRTRAERVDGGWRINGTKLWTTNAHRAHFMVALCRTAPAGDDRRSGLSQFLIDMKTPGLTVRPILNLASEHDFNEVHFDDAFVPATALIGEEGKGFSQVSAELAYERSGPERWLSSFRVWVELIDALREHGDSGSTTEVGRMLAHLVSLRQMSISVAAMLQAGKTPNTQAAIVKELGTRFDQEVPRLAHRLFDVVGLGRNGGAPTRAHNIVDHALLWSPAFTLRGGTTEILRGIIARELGLR